MSIKKVCIFGGTGFVGRSLLNQLSSLGISARVFTRARASAKQILITPDIEIIEGHTDSAALKRAIQGCDAVINLVGVLHDRPKGEFQRAHVDLPKAIYSAAHDVGVSRIIHMSALGASTHGNSHYLRSRGQGEDVALAEMSTAKVTILRPSIIYGRYDKFTNLFAQMMQVLPAIPLAGADSKFQPIWVEDVARAILECLVGERATQTIGRSFDLGGPQVFTFKEVLQQVSAAIGKRRWVVGLPAPIATLQALAFEILPGAPIMTRDNLASMKTPNVCAKAWPDIFSFMPAGMPAVITTYLGKNNLQPQYDSFRSRAQR